MEERITLCKYTTQIFMKYTFVRYTFLFYLKKQGQNCYEYKILKYRKLKMILSILSSHRTLLNNSFC